MHSIIIRFPDGSREFRWPVDGLDVGDVISHDGERYCVVAITPEDGGPRTATVELDSDDLKDVLRSERGAIVLTALAE